MSIVNRDAYYCPTVGPCWVGEDEEVITTPGGMVHCRHCDGHVHHHLVTVEFPTAKEGADFTEQLMHPNDAHTQPGYKPLSAREAPLRANCPPCTWGEFDSKTAPEKTGFTYHCLICHREFVSDRKLDKPLCPVSCG